MSDDSDTSAGITAPRCASFGCIRGGVIRSEEHNAQLCPMHALHGPVRQSEKGVPVLNVHALDRAAEQTRYAAAVNEWVRSG